jgi:type IX secretion system PorP/SprF family membrane protein
MKRMLLSLLFGLLLYPIFSQNDPVYSQYMFNPLIINPAYAGVHDMASLYAVYRNQWTGFGDGNPETFTVSGHSTIPKNNIGLGFTYVNDKVGIQESNEFNAIGSYKLDLGKHQFLSFGLQAGFFNLKYDYNLNVKDDDDLFPEGGVGKGNQTSPTVGGGFLWTSKKLFIGLSVPRFLDMTIDDETQSHLRINRNILVTGGYVFHLGNSLQFKPSVMVRYVEGTEVNYDLNASLLFKERVWFGTSVRTLNTMSVMTQIKATDLITTGLAYEFPIDSKKLNQVGNTFELMLNLNMALLDIQAVQTIFY